jgi:hypothetical protein
VIVELASDSKYELTGEGALKIVSPLQPPLRLLTENHMFASVPISESDLSRLVQPETLQLLL